MESREKEGKTKVGKRDKCGTSRELKKEIKKEIKTENKIT